MAVPRVPEDLEGEAAAPPPPLTPPQRWAVAVLATGSAALAAMAFVGMFRPVRHAMVAWFGSLAWMIPVGTDIGIVLMSLFSMLFEWLNMSAGAIGMRLASWVFIGMQLGINVGVAKGDPEGSAGHAVLPVLFVGILEGWQYFIRFRRGLTGNRKPRKTGKDRERIPSARWRADWRGTREVKRLMVLWGIDQYRTALAMRQRILYAHASLEHMYGHTWHSEAPREILVMLGTADLLEKALAEIAAMRADFDKGKNPRPGWVTRTINSASSGNGGGGEIPKGESAKGQKPPQPIPASGTTACTACAVHRAEASGTVLPIGQAAAVWAEYGRVHQGSTVGVDRLRVLFRIGTSGARQLRNQLAAGTDPAAVAGSGPAGSGPAGSGRPVGSGPGAGSAPESDAGTDGPVGSRVLAGVGAGVADAVGGPARCRP